MNTIVMPPRYAATFRGEPPVTEKLAALDRLAEPARYRFGWPEFAAAAVFAFLFGVTASAAVHWWPL